MTVRFWPQGDGHGAWAIISATDPKQPSNYFLGAAMSFVSELIDIAAADTDVLRSLDEQGDNFAIPRDVDFLLRAPDKDKAALVCGLVNDYNYGNATIQEADGFYAVAIVIHMPVTQHVIHSVSGFIATICQLYQLEYDGWGCVAQKT